MRQKAYVFAGHDIIAESQRQYDGTNRLAWQLVNPITGDGLSIDAQRIALQRTNVDPMGVNLGDADPFVSNEPTNGGDGAGMSQSSINAMVASIMPGYGGPTCKVDGLVTGCRFAFGMLASGAAEKGPSQTTTGVYSRSLGTYIGIATWDPNQAAAGVSAFGLPAGWSINGMSFTGSGFTFSSAFPIDDMTKIYGKLGFPSLGGYLGDLVQQGYGSFGQLSEAFVPFRLDDPPLTLRAPMDVGVLTRVDELIQKPRCSQFLNEVLAELAKATGRGREGVTFEALFNSARGSIYSVNPWWARGSGSPDGILVGNPAFHIEILMRDERPGDRADAPTSIMHEVFHGAPGGGANYTHFEMADAAYTVGGRMGLLKEHDYGNPDKPNAGYEAAKTDLEKRTIDNHNSNLFQDILIQACTKH
jgi:hypothetical protein